MTYQVIQAYVRPQLAARVIQALLDAGCDDLFIAEAKRVAAGLHAEDLEYSVQISQRIETMTRLEVIGTLGEVAQWVQVIREAGSSRRPGDGVVTVSVAVEHFHLSGSPHGSGHTGQHPAERRKEP